MRTQWSRESKTWDKRSHNTMMHVVYPLGEIHGEKDMYDEDSKKAKGIFRPTAPEFGPDTRAVGLNFASISNILVWPFGGNNLII